MILRTEFKLQVTIDLADQLRRILAYAPADIALLAEIDRNPEVIAVGAVDFDQVTVDDRGIDLARGQQVEHILDLHAIRRFDDLDIRIALFL